MFEPAIEIYKKYFDYNPYNFALYKKIAFLYIDLGKSTQAIPYLKQAVILEPQDREVKDALEVLSK